MKKLFSILAIACMAVSVFTSCGKKDDPVDPQKPDKTPAFAGIMFKATFDEQTMEQCDISFDYYDENGQIKNEVVTETVYQKKIKSEGLPATLGFRWNVAPKKDLDTTKYEHFKVTYQFEYNSAAYNAEGTSVTTPVGASFGNSVEMAMKKRDAVIEILEGGHKILNFLHIYDANANVTEDKWK